MKSFLTVCTVTLVSATLFALSSCVLPSSSYDQGYSGQGDHDYNYNGYSHHDGGYHDDHCHDSSHHDGDYHHSEGYHY